MPGIQKVHLKPIVLKITKTINKDRTVPKP